MSLGHSPHLSCDPQWSTFKVKHGKVAFVAEFEGCSEFTRGNRAGTEYESWLNGASFLETPSPSDSGGWGKSCRYHRVDRYVLVSAVS